MRSSHFCGAGAVCKQHYVCIVIIIIIQRQKKIRETKIMCRKLGRNGVEHFFNKTLKKNTLMQIQTSFVYGIGF